MVHPRGSVVALVLAACSMYDQPCACGGRWTDLLGRPPSPQSTISHARADHCVCRCGGTDEELLMPPFERECSAFEIECRRSDGAAARFVCL